MSGFTAVGFFLVHLIFGLLIFSLWFRLALRYLRVSTLDPFSKIIYSVTDPILTPLNTLFKQPVLTSKPYDWMAFFVLLAVETLKVICLGLMSFHAVMPISLLFIYVVADLIIQPCDLLFYAILFRVIMSYTSPRWHNPLADFIRLITEPLLKKGRQMVPTISGFDFSPFLIMVLLKIITLFIINTLPFGLF